MTAMEILRRCRRAERDIASIRQRIQRRRDALTCIAPKGGPPAGRGGEQDKIASMLADIDGMERELSDRKEAMNAEITAAARLLDALPDAESETLHLYYVMRLTCAQIAKRQQLSESRIRRMKRNGETMLGQRWPQGAQSLLPAWYIAQVVQQETRQESK